MHVRRPGVPLSYACGEINESARADSTYTRASERTRAVKNKKKKTHTRCDDDASHVTRVTRRYSADGKGGPATSRPRSA